MLGVGWESEFVGDVRVFDKEKDEEDVGKMAYRQIGKIETFEIQLVIQEL